MITFGEKPFMRPSFLSFVLVAGMLQFSVTACSDKKDSICSCIESGNALNKKANVILGKRATEKDRSELKRLKADKQKKCAEFERMSGEAMRERMQDCK